MLSRTTLHVRAFLLTLRVLAKATGHNTAKKSVSFKPKKDQTVGKAKKGGMTHHEFREAVTQLGYEKGAQPLQVPELTSVESLGDLYKYSDATKSKFNELKVIQPYQHHEMFSEPISMTTTNTEQILKQVLSKLQGPSKDNRVCLVGAKGIGKSTLLMQAMALANSLDATQAPVFLHIPNANAIVDGLSDYILNQKTGKYQQPMFTKRWIWKLKNANADVFKQLKLSRDFTYEKDRKEVTLVKGENTVYDLLNDCHDFGKYGPTNAFQFFVEELQHQSQNVPVLVTIDRANGLFDFPITEYRHADFSLVHVSQLEIGDWLLKVVSGEFNFTKGGVILAQSSDFSAHRKSMKVGLGLEVHSPYEKAWLFDIDIANAMLANGGVKPIEVAPFTKDETSKLLEFYQQAGVLQATQGETEFTKIANNQYTLSGGNPWFLVQAAAFAY